MNVGFPPLSEAPQTDAPMAPEGEMHRTSPLGTGSTPEGAGAHPPRTAMVVRSRRIRPRTDCEWSFRSS